MALSLRLSSDPVTIERMLDLESDTIRDVILDTIHESNKPVPGMWQFPTHRDLCCIYRVPYCLRRENPEAYTPQMVLIGPLHHSLKFQAPMSRGDITNVKSMAYLNMEEHKKIYLAKLAKRVEGKKHIDGFRRIIEEDETIIRASYLESTAWIESPEFVDMILHDSVFILEHILRASTMDQAKTGDPLIDEPCLESTIKKDLILLENQLPYFILEKLFEPVIKILDPNETLRRLVIKHFIPNTKEGDSIKIDSPFRHFTDLVRCARVGKLPDKCFEVIRNRKQMYNAEKLHNGGVKFKAVEFTSKLYVEFVDGCLKIPTLFIGDDEEITLRDIIALEQCHYPYKAHVCNYVIFLDFLIDTEKDVDFLVEKGIIINAIGHNGAVATMVNKLCLGIIDTGSYYTEIESNVKAHYHSRFKRSLTILKRGYKFIFGEYKQQ